MTDINFNTNSVSPLSILELKLENGAKIWDSETGYSCKNALWEQMYGTVNLPVTVIINNDSIDMNKDGNIDVLDLVLLINKFNK